MSNSASLARARLLRNLGASQLLRSWTLIGMGCVLTVGCGGSKKEAKQPEPIVEGRRGDDESRCEFRGRDDRDVQESSSPGSIVSNVRRVYGYIGTSSERRRVLLCREVDTNLDGVKDLLRTYGDDGERLTEQADSDYNGKIDTWIAFGRSKPVKVEVDKNGDGRPDEIRFYTAGKLARLQKDTNGDDQPDVFEIYDSGRLERIGLDLDFDGKVDTWRRDQVRARELEEKERTETAAAGEEKSQESPAE
jgi:hypothetical protein